LNLVDEPFNRWETGHIELVDYTKVGLPGPFLFNPYFCPSAFLDVSNSDDESFRPQTCEFDACFHNLDNSAIANGESWEETGTMP
jgi:hypothetical protein